MQLALAVVLVVVVFVWLRPTETKRVRKVFTTVSKEIHKDGPEGLVVAAAKAHALAELVAAGATFELDGEFLRDVGGRQLLQQITLVRGQCERISVDFADIVISFVDDRTASVSADIYVRGLSDALGISGRDARQVETVLEKDADDGKWRFTTVRLLPVVSK